MGAEAINTRALDKSLGNERQKRMSRGFGSGVPLVVLIAPSGVRGASLPSSLSSFASASHSHYLTHATGSVDKTS